MENLDIYNKVRRVPEDAKRVIKGGRLNGYTDINPMWRIKTLTECFGVCGIGWYFDIDKKWLETVDDEVCAFADISLYIKVDGEWSKPIRGTGGSRLATKEKNGIYVSDECYKMALTDAISVACKQLGIGADVYWSMDNTKYRDPHDRSDTKRAEPVRGAQNRQEPLVTRPMIENLKREIDRVGWNINGLLSWIKAARIEDITVGKYKFAMEKLEEKPDKIPEPYHGSLKDLAPDESLQEDYENIPFN